MATLIARLVNNLTPRVVGVLVLVAVLSVSYYLWSSRAAAVVKPSVGKGPRAGGNAIGSHPLLRKNANPASGHPRADPSRGKGKNPAANVNNKDPPLNNKLDNKQELDDSHNTPDEDIILNVQEPQKIEVSNLAKWVHLDLKAAAPSMDYLLSLVPLLKKWGASGVLIEYEDMFPFEEELQILQAKNCYKKFEVTKFIKTIEQNNMAAVPLVQTFGHLEFVLKHPKYAEFREDPLGLCCLNTGKPGARKLVTDMIDQVMKLHPNSRIVHIGADEVYSLGSSAESKKLMREQNLTEPLDLYLFHLKNVAEHIHIRNPGTRILIWEDMIRWKPLEVIERSNIASYVEPMVWNYVPEVRDRLPDIIWEKYSKVFKTVWAASSFKGASGSMQHLPNLATHVENNIGWLSIIREVSNAYPEMKFEGIALTGWSRYDHFSAMCELLPASLPSLAMCLGILQSKPNDVGSDLLFCPSSPYESKDGKPDYVYKPLEDDQCNFPGHDIFYFMLEYHNVLKNFEFYFDPLTGYANGVCNRFSLGHQYMDPRKAERTCVAHAQDALGKFNKIREQAASAFGAIYRNDMTVEWLEENVVVFEDWLHQYEIRVRDAAAKNRVFGARPDRHVDKLAGG